MSGANGDGGGREAIVSAVTTALDTSRVVITNRLLHEPIPPPRFVWERLVLAGEVNALSGSTGAGKSKLCAGLAVAISAGLGSFLGQPCESGTVAFISGEDDLTFYLRQIRAWCITLNVDVEKIKSRITFYHLPSIVVEGMPTRLTVHTRNGLVVNAPLIEGLVKSLDRDGDFFTQHLEQNDNDEPIARDPLRLIVCETVSTLKSGDESNESMAELVRAGALLAHRVRSAPAVVITHHTAKVDMKEQKALRLGSGRGGGAFESNARASLTLGYEQNQGVVLRCHKVRDAMPAPPIPLTWGEVEVDGSTVGILVPQANTPAAAVQAQPVPPGALETPPPLPEAVIAAQKDAVRQRRTSQVQAILTIVRVYAERGEPLTKNGVAAHPSVSALLARDAARELVDRMLAKHVLVAAGKARGGNITLALGPGAAVLLPPV